MAHFRGNIAEPTRPCVLIHTKLDGKKDFLKKLKTYVMCAPHLEAGGDGNNAYVVEVFGHVCSFRESRVEQRVKPCRPFLN